MEGILSPENRKRIAKGQRPRVDSQWVEWFPGDAEKIDEVISPHHIGGSAVTVPLPYSRHLEAHMPGGYTFNIGGPGVTG